jgi:hypothetical protein
MSAEIYRTWVHHMDATVKHNLDELAYMDAAQLAACQLELGNGTPLDAYNVHDYIDEFCKAQTVGQCRRQLMAFKYGFYIVNNKIHNVLLTLMTTMELHAYCSGIVITPSELRDQCRVDESVIDNPCLATFWEILQDLSQTQLQEFVSFFNGSPYLHKLWSLKANRPGHGVDMFTAKTCTCVLFLPRDTTHLKEKLLASIQCKTLLLE